MIIAQQKRFYFPAWNDCAKALDWHMVKGKLLAPREERNGLVEADKLYNQVWDAAEKIAREAHRAVTATDLRHACHVVAIGRDLSSHEMSNNQTDRVVNLFRLLARPDDIKAARSWADPEEAERNRLVWSIQKMAPEAYICTICQNRHDWNYTAPFWEDLPLAQLRQLAMTLRNRIKNRQEPIASKVGRDVPSAPLGNVGSNDTFAPSAEDAPQMVNVNRNVEEPF